jgi:hypothetical protein
MLYTLKHHEAQRLTARRIKYIHGKNNMGSTPVVSVNDGNGNWINITEKATMESAIMRENETKY